MQSHLIERALRVALDAHEGQLDKAGAPYILHPLRVMHATRNAGGSTEAMAAALLHDVLEDTPLTRDDLLRKGIPEPIVEIVETLTRPEGKTYQEYIESLARHSTARLIKLADLQDNLDLTRIGELSEKHTSLVNRYLKAHRTLQEI